jgi:hypothetical protein
VVVEGWTLMKVVKMKFEWFIVDDANAKINYTK